MKKEEIIKTLMATIGNTTLTCVEGSLVGSLAIIDEINADFKEQVRCNIRRMFQDKSYYIQRGGWNKFTQDENKYYLEKALDEIEKQGYEFVSIDFYDETNGVLFVKLNMINTGNFN